MNPLFQKMNPQTKMLNQLKNNPVAFLQQRGINIPQGMTNPNDILTYLMQTGKVSQAQYNAAVNKAQLFT